MFEYAVYIRTEEGYIERMDNVISDLPCDPRKTYGSLAPYMHEEKLVGFPESVVLWKNITGPSTGIAPINRHSHSADSNPPPYCGLESKLPGQLGGDRGSIPVPDLMEGRVNKRQFTLDRGKELKKHPLHT